MSHASDKTPRGNIIAGCILIGVMVVLGAYEWSQGNRGGQQTAAAHHSIRSSAGGDSGSGG